MHKSEHRWLVRRLQDLLDDAVDKVSSIEAFAFDDSDGREYVKADILMVMQEFAGKQRLSDVSRKVLDVHSYHPERPEDPAEIKR